MGFYDNITQFYGKKVVDFSPEKGIEQIDVAYRFFTNYDGDHDVPDNLRKFIKDVKAGQVSALVFGVWNEEHDETPDEILNILIENKDHLQSIKAVFVGDITQEENEVSWIENTSYSKFLAAFPQLEVFRVRGGNSLSIGVLKQENLKKIIIETGGMGSDILNDLSKSDLPALEHLELWLGTEEYGFSANASEVIASYRGNDDDHFPSLRYLGLRNSEIADELAAKLMDDPILNRIEVLDLSQGNISDEGAEALIDNPSIKNLKNLILDHHYISDEVMEQLKDLGIPVSLEEQEEADEDDDEIYRYIAVSE